MNSIIVFMIMILALIVLLYLNLRVYRISEDKSSIIAISVIEIVLISTLAILQLV